MAHAVRPLPDVPALAASMERLKRRCEEAAAAKAVTINGESGEPLVATGRAEQPHDLAQPKPSPTPAAIPERLQWQKPIGEARRSACGRYAVCRVTVNGKRHYEVWRMVPSGNWFNRIGPAFESFQSAANHANENAGAS